MSESYTDTNPTGESSNNTSTTKRKNESAENPEDANPRPKIKYNPDALYYDMSGDRLMIIFNHSKYEASPYYKYQAPAPRTGTEQDVKSLKSVFGDLFGFKVVTHHDKSCDEIWDICEDLSKDDHSTTSCLCFVFLTHGEKNGELFARDQTYMLRPIITMFEGLPTLVTKPKLFFIQACRGSMIDDGTMVTTDGGPREEKLLPSHADFFFMRSTVEDYRSFRDKNGSWMIQELCSVMEDYGDKFDLLQIATLVHQNVANERTSYSTKMPAIHNKKQMPETTFTLTKLLRFK